MARWVLLGVLLLSSPLALAAEPAVPAEKAEKMVPLGTVAVGDYTGQVLFQAPADDGKGYRVNGDDGVGQVELGRQRGNRRDVVRFRRRRDLARGDARLARSGADDVRRAEIVARVARAAAGLAVDGRQAASALGRTGKDRFGPAADALLKRLGLQDHQQSPQAVTRRQSVWQGQESFQPSLLKSRPAVNRRRPRTATDDSTGRDDNLLEDAVARRVAAAEKKRPRSANVRAGEAAKTAGRRGANW